MANANKESWWTKWLRNGRLSGLSFGVMLIVHVTMTFLNLPTDGIQPVLILFAGTFVGNLALRKEADDREKDREKNRRIDELEKKVENESTE